MSGRVGMLAGLLVLVLGSGVVAQSPSPEPPPWFGGQRVEMPEHGFAVTVPDGWFAFDLTGDVEEQARAAMVANVPDASEGAIEEAISFVRSLQDRGGQLALADRSAFSNCTVLVGPAVGWDPDWLATGMYDFVSSDEQVLHAELPQVVALPAGEARLVTYGVEAKESAAYMGEGAGKVFNVECVGGDRPADDWLAVVETLEWLPSSEPLLASPPPWFGGRVEMPEDGFALTLPHGWAAIDLTGDADRQARTLAAALQPYASDEELEVRAAAYLGEGRAGERLVLVSKTTADACSIVVMPPTEADLDSLAERAYARGSRDEQVLHAELPQVVALPAGEARLLTQDYEDGTELAAYLLQGTDAIVLLGCTGSAQPEGDWLSIAETIEFLPAEE